MCVIVVMIVRDRVASGRSDLDFLRREHSLESLDLRRKLRGRSPCTRSESRNEAVVGRRVGPQLPSEVKVRHRRALVVVDNDRRLLLLHLLRQKPQDVFNF